MESNIKQNMFSFLSREKWGFSFAETYIVAHHDSLMNNEIGTVVLKGENSPNY